MLIILLVWLNAIIIFTAFGILGIYFFNKFIPQKEKLGQNLPDLDFIIITGMVIIATLCSYISLFSPVDSILNIILLITSIFILIFLKPGPRILMTQISLSHKSRAGKITFFISLVGFLFFLLATSTPIQNYDSGLYHIQIIKWIHNYPIVPGLGNLEIRFAGNSHFFVLSSLFTFDEISPIPLFPINGLLVVLLFLRIMKNANNSIHSKDFFQLTFDLIFISLFLSYDLQMIQSPSPDTTMAIFVYYALYILIQSLRSNNVEKYFLIQNQVGIFILFFLPAIRISAAPAVLLAPLLITKKYFKASFLFSLVMALIIVVPYIFRNVLLSGYLLFPLAKIDLFSFDWKIPQESVRTLSAIIRSWAILPGMDNFMKAENLHFYEWFPQWWNQKDKILKIVLLTNFLTPLSILFFIKEKKIKHAYYSTIIFIWFLFWLLSAPDPRFAYGILFAHFAFLLVKLSDRLPKKLLKIRFILVCLLILPLIIRIIIVPFWIHMANQPSITKNKYQYVKNRLLLPSPILPTPVKSLKVSAGLKVNIPVTGDQCFDAKLPCTPYSPSNIKTRGQRLEDGFSPSIVP